MRTFIAALTAACALSAVPALAQTSPPPKPAPSAAASPSPTPSPSPRPWQASGYAAASYNASSLGSGTQGFSFANGGASRVFDTISRQPMLNAINVQLQKNGAVFGKVELTAGTNANVIASYPYANNMNISRSILFGYAVPFTHTGARLTYTATPLFTAIAGVNNGWDNLKGPGGPKTAELGLAYNGPVFQLTAQSYLGMERASDAMWSATGDSPAGHRSLVDLVGTYKATPALTFVANYDDGRQTAVPLVNGAGTPIPGLGTATWNGIAGYAQYAITPKLTAALRGETFSDRGGYRTGFDQQWRETTLTFAYAPSAYPVVFRVEGRADTSNHPVWIDQSGTFRNAMQSVAAQVLVKF